MTSSTTSPEKRGIVVAILGGEGGDGAGAATYSRPGGSASLRRTLSADMSSKKWLEQNGFSYSSPMKKIASSKDFSLNPILDSFSSSEDDEEEEVVEIKKDFDIWSSIISQKVSGEADSSKSLPPPYVHPLVKRSASSLSEKSLQICTESLGSETGSDGFSASSYSSSDAGDDSESEGCCQKEAAEESTAGIICGSPARKPAAARTTSFPPPLPSLSSRCGGDGTPTLRMRSRRDNGRLVVEAVSVPASQKNFAAQRQDGRLVLMFAGKTSDGTDHDEQTKIETQTENEIEIEEEDEEVLDHDMMSKARVVTETRLINFHRLALMADKRRNNPAAAWLNKGGDDEEEEEEERKPAASLPPRPRGPVGRLIPAPAAAKVSTTAAASFNHYEYFWRTKITGAPNDNKLVGKNQTTENDKRQLVVLRRNRGDSYFVSSLKGCCKEPRRTLTWEPRCIATS